MAATTVLLVGTCGAGKSTLGNFLLYGTPRRGFACAAGREPVTTTCECIQDNSQQGSPFMAIDTPGVPDPNGNTKTHFNSIVEETRARGSLNAVVFVMDYSVNRNDVARDARNASVLLEQFNKLGCTTIVACRVPPHVAGLDEEEIRQAELCWNDYVTEVSNAAGLRISLTYLLGTDIVSHAREIRQALSRCPVVDVSVDSGMQTYGELRRCVENRRNDHTRGEQLQKDIERLTRETNALERTIGKLQGNVEWRASIGRSVQTMGGVIQGMDTLILLAGAVATAEVLFGTVLIISATGTYKLMNAITQKNISLHTATIAENNEAMRAMTAEVETGHVDAERLKRDEVTMQKLDGLDA